MRSDISALYPSIYNGILETDILAEIGDIQYNQLFDEMTAARRNLFVMTADVRGVEAFEHIYNIRADMQTETLEFRRQRLLNRMNTVPPFTIRFLRERLDSLIGVGRYNVWVEDYTLHVEATTGDAGWYHEVAVFIDRIKPANIVYILLPLMVAGVLISEEIARYIVRWNYALDGSWRLGELPFISYETIGEQEVAKMPEVPSLTNNFLESHAQHSAEIITSVLLNDDVRVSNFIERSADGTEAVLGYALPDGHGLSVINSIKLLGADDTVLSDVSVYIPIAEGMTLRHRIHHKEGMPNVT